MKIVTPKQMNALDQMAMETYHIPGLLLMEHAALAVVDHLRKRLCSIRNPFVFILCGTGNNGGDGLAVARLLHQKGIRTQAVLLGKPQRLKGDAKTNFEMASKVGVQIVEYVQQDCATYKKQLEDADVVVDALLGTGYDGRTLYDEMAQMIRLLNEYATEIVSVDIPTGVNGLTSHVGQDAVRAHTTITFCLPKIGLCIHPGKAHAGKIIVADIGIPKQAISTTGYVAEWVDKEYARKLMPARAQDSHKTTYGRLLMIAGQPGMTGACTLAAQAAYRTGAGLVYLITDDQNHAQIDCIEAVKMPVLQNDQVPDMEKIRSICEDKHVLVLGPGMGMSQRTKDMVHAFLSLHNKKIVLDADALNMLANQTNCLKDSDNEIVITPHPLEMARLIGKDAKYVQENRLEVAQTFAVQHGVTVVLKGAATVVADANERVFVNHSGSSALSTAGTGDVLCGMIAAWIGQGVETTDACVLSVYIHGLAGSIAEQKYTAYGVKASDVVESIPEGIKSLLKDGETVVSI